MSEKAAKTKDSSNNGELIKASDINLQLDNVVNVPIAIMKRVNSLKNLQVKLLEIESKFFEELHLLECKYSTLYEPLYEKRKQIINGDYEPTEDESKWTLDDDLDLTTESENKVADAKSPAAAEKSEGAGDSADLAKELKAKANLSDIGSGAIDVKGVPDFWLQTFKSVELISDMIQEYDEPVLKHLYDVKVKLHDQKPYGYTLEFYFNENDYFTNSVLTKSYELRTEIDNKDPFSYEGPDLYKCKGCVIDWKKGKNVTVRLIKKKQKHKGHGTIRVITKEIKQDSFFNYFDNPEGITDDSKTPLSSSTEDGKSKNKADTSKSEHDEEDDELKDESLLAADFEIGHFFKERIIPKAVLYFTGEIADDDYDDYDDQDEDDDLDDDDNSDQDDDDDDDDDEGHNRRPHRRHDDSKSNDDESKKPHGGKGKSNKGGNKSSDPNSKNNPPECKQN